MRSLYRSLDEAGWLMRLLKWFRDFLPARRGLLTLGAIGVAILSLCVHILWLATGNVVVALCGVVLLHGALILGFGGLLLAEALGRGYRE
ncbi:MAG: hypothetical protein IT323_19770 [Anaerolineae bacterium]|nr:hypothetical protein [Anaerolineae bacterium]